jgi:pSer/pThr/pTyr-binding forkhead associated (FHA) protein/CheY-like chemotaxis protein
MVESQLPWVVELKASQMPHPIKAQFEKRLVIGRHDRMTNFKPDVDLGPFHAEESGISRQHAALVAEQTQLMVVDLNSGNGTYLNGTRLSPNDPVPLRQSDHLQLAQLPIEVRVVMAPSYAVGFFNDVSMQMNESALRGSGQSILIVKRDDAMARVLAAALDNLGYRAVTARSVVNAIRVFNQQQPAAIILDMMLPDMPGLELCRYVRRDTHGTMTPLIVVASNKSPVVVAESLDSGADVILSEPISIKELQHVVSTLVKRPDQGAPGFQTKHLVGTAPLQAIQPQTRRNSVVIFVAGSKDPMVLTVTQPITFGRSVSQTLRSHIDLTRSNAVDNGVSRVHARLHYENDTFYIEDMNSVNGTYVNGDPLKPGVKVPLKSADEIRLGRLRLYAYFLEDSDNSD